LCTAAARFSPSLARAAPPVRRPRPSPPRGRLTSDDLGHVGRLQRERRHRDLHDAHDDHHLGRGVPAPGRGGRAGGRAGGWVGGWAGGWVGGWVGGRAGGWAGGWVGGWAGGGGCGGRRDGRVGARCSCRSRPRLLPAALRRPAASAPSGGKAHLGRQGKSGSRSAYSASLLTDTPWGGGERWEAVGGGALWDRGQQEQQQGGGLRPRHSSAARSSLPAFNANAP
jgi:hypothetical protein